MDSGGSMVSEGLISSFFDDKSGHVIVILQ